MFDLFQPTHLLFVLLVALAVFPKHLVEMSRSLGRNLHKFKEYKEELKEELLGISDEERTQGEAL